MAVENSNQVFKLGFMEKTKSPVVLQGEKIEEKKKDDKGLYTAEFLGRMTTVVGISTGVQGGTGVNVRYRVAGRARRDQV